MKTIGKYVLIAMLFGLMFLTLWYGLGDDESSLSSQPTALPTYTDTNDNKDTDDLLRYRDAQTGTLYFESAGIATAPDLCAEIPVDIGLLTQSISFANNTLTTFSQDLTCFVNLKILDLSFNQLSDLEGLILPVSLTTLRLNKNNFATLDLPNAPALRSLHVGYNALESLTGLEQYPVLEELMLQHNPAMTSVSGVERLTQLKMLKLEFNEFTQLPSLDALENLVLVTAKGNPLSAEILAELDILNAPYIEKLREE